VHCLVPLTRPTSDHVFPKSWYPDTTPDNLGKWRIPSCPRCNADYGKLENYLLIRIGLCLDPDDPRSLGIVEKALRAIDPTAAKNERDRIHRERKRQQILKEAFFGQEMPHQATYPNFGDIWGQRRSEQIALRISAKTVARLTEKIVRDIMFLEDGEHIEPPLAIHSYAIQDDKASPIKTFLKRRGTVYAREPGIVVSRAVSDTGSVKAMYIHDQNLGSIQKVCNGNQAIAEHGCLAGNSTQQVTQRAARLQDTSTGPTASSLQGKPLIFLRAACARNG